MNPQHRIAENVEPEPDADMAFYVFMIVFWPVAMILGLIDYYYVSDHDLRVLTLVLGALAGWIGVEVYRRREEKQGEAA